MRLSQIVTLIAASTGAVPLVLCAMYSETLLLLANGGVTITGILYATSSNEAAWPNTTVTQVTLETANASFGVLFALACACRVSAFLTIVGAFRALWLVTIVTSSCGYSSVRSLNPQLTPIIPNDLTLIALAIGGAVFACSVCASLCRKERSTASRDGRVLAMEILLVVGALAIRYQNDLDGIVQTKTDAGWSTWYVCCHLTTTTIVLISHQRRGLTKQDDTPP